MNDLQSIFIKYIKHYIEILTEGRDEFFISLCDIDEEFLKSINSSDFQKYKVAVVNNEDYSEAVHYRNDINVQRIVLLSGEGIKQIDSLKDFNEYSVLPQDKDLLLECIEKVFEIQLGAKANGVLEVILEQSEVSFIDLLTYLNKCITKGKIVPTKMNKNLSLLGIWKSNDKEFLFKGKIRRMIKNSRYSVVDNRLTRALMNHKIKDKKQERQISAALSKGDLQSIFSSIPYETAVENEWLKQAPRDKKENLVASASVEEKIYRNSYEYMLSEELSDDIKEIKQEWMIDRIKVIEKEWMTDHIKENAEFIIGWSDYQLSKEDIGLSNRQINQMTERVKISNLPFNKREEIINRILELSDAFVKVQKKVCEATPVCLKSFCDLAETYTKIYLELLSDLITDERFRDMDAAREIMQEYLLLFCRVQNRCIQMPYYHPIRVFYYMTVLRLYEIVLEENDRDEVKNMVWCALVDKVGMQFPIEFIRKGDKRFTLDNTTILKAYTDFGGMDDGTIYSVLDFKIVQQQILDYIIRHPYLTYYKICLIDISEISGLFGIVHRIRKLSAKEKYNIGRVDFLILSAKEEELKKMLSQMWDAIGADDIVRFRFGRNAYLSDGKYNLVQITKESDMIIMADNELLYREPRMAAYKNNVNSAFARIKKFNLKEQVERYIGEGTSDIPVMWDTMQQIAFEGQEGFWRWKSRELDSRILELINRTVHEDKDKTFVILSSNEHILSEIYQTQYMKAFRKKYNGKNITVLCFSSEQEEDIKIENNSILCSLSELYDEAFGLEKLPEKILPDVEDILLEIWNEDRTNICQCIVQTNEDETEIAPDGKEICEKWMDWQFNKFLKKKNVLTMYFRDLWRNQLNAGDGEIFSILLAENLCKGVSFSYRYKEEHSNLLNKMGKRAADCTQAVKVHELLQFLSQKPIIDKRTKNLFQERYDSNLPLKILNTKGCKELLEEKEYEQLIKLEERIREN